MADIAISDAASSDSVSKYLLGDNYYLYLLFIYLLILILGFSFVFCQLVYMCCTALNNQIMSIVCRKKRPLSS
jgi:ABC-type protease/lipase transport system fused ATPase/permease subunit